MSGFRMIDRGVDAIQFDDGTTVWMKRELSGWDRDQLRSHMLRVYSAAQGNDPQVELHSGDRKALELVMVSITGADGKDVPVTPQLLESLDAETWARLVAEADKRLRPLAPPAAQTGSPTTSSEAGPTAPPTV